MTSGREQDLTCSGQCQRCGSFHTFGVKEGREGGCRGGERKQGGEISAGGMQDSSVLPEGGGRTTGAFQRGGDPDAQEQCQGLLKEVRGRGRACPP